MRNFSDVQNNCYYFEYSGIIQTIAGSFLPTNIVHGSSIKITTSLSKQLYFAIVFGRV